MMKKICASLTILTIFVIFNSCINKEKPITTTDIETQAVYETQVVNELDYIKTKPLDVYNGIAFYKSVSALSVVYPKVTNIPLRSDLYALGQIQAIDEYGNLYYNKQNTNGEKGTSQITLYDIKSNEIKPLIKLTNDHNCAIATVKYPYLVWLEDANSNWQSTSLHIMNVSTNEDREFYKDTINPKTGLTYVWRYNSPVILDNKVYYDDVVGMDENGIFDIQLSAYDINNDKTEILYRNVKQPMTYKNKLAYLKRDNDKVNSVFFSDNTNVVKSTSRLGTVYNADNDIIIFNDYMSQAVFDYIEEQYETSWNGTDQFYDTINDPAVSVYGIKMYQKGKISPIIVSNYNSVSNLNLNARFITWSAMEIGQPMFYDIKNDKLINIDMLNGINVLSYEFVLSGDYLLLSYTETSDSLHVKNLLLSFEQY